MENSPDKKKERKIDPVRLQRIVINLTLLEVEVFRPDAVNKYIDAHASDIKFNQERTAEVLSEVIEHLRLQRKINPEPVIMARAMEIAAMEDGEQTAALWEFASEARHRHLP